MSITDGRKEKNSEKENIFRGVRCIQRTSDNVAEAGSGKRGGGFKRAKCNIIKSIPIQTHPFGFILLFLHFGDQPILTSHF